MKITSNTPVSHLSTPATPQDGAVADTQAQGKSWTASSTNHNIVFTINAYAVHKEDGIELVLHNLQDSAAMIKLIQSELNVLLQMLSRVRDLTEQDEAFYSQLVMNMNRLIESANFNGIPLLDGTLHSIVVQHNMLRKGELQMELLNAAALEHHPGSVSPLNKSIEAITLYLLESEAVLKQLHQAIKKGNRMHIFDWDASQLRIIAEEAAALLFGGFKDYKDNAKAIMLLGLVVFVVVFFITFYVIAL